jgi:hypothetical protein
VTRTTTTKVLAGIALATLAAAAVAAIVNHRQGHKPDPDGPAYLDELDVRLNAAEQPGSDKRVGLIGRILDGMQRNQDISVTRLRRWIAGMRQGTLSPEQAIVAESDFDALEREAQQGGL